MYNACPAISIYIVATVPSYIAVSWVAKAQPIGQVELFGAVLALSTWSSELTIFPFPLHQRYVGFSMFAEDI